jgi:hypothetical protein
MDKKPEPEINAGNVPVVMADTNSLCEEEFGYEQNAISCFRDLVLFIANTNIVMPVFFV